MAAPQLSPFGHALAGALGGVFSNAIVYPLDTVKTVIQANKHHEKTDKRKEGSPPDSMIGLLLRIFNEEGLLGYYKGFGATMLNTFSTQYAYFFFYSTVRSSYIKRLVKKLPPGSPIPALSTAMELILGAVAGALAQIFTIPVSVIAVRQQISQTKRKLPTPQTVTESKSFADAVKEPSSEQPFITEVEVDEDNSFLGVARRIVKENGVTGLWLGIRAALVLTVNPAITYGVFERVKTLVLLNQPNKRMSPGVAFLVGALSKTLATVVTYPYIMAKVRIQAGADPLPRPATDANKDSTSTKGGEGAISLLSRVHREKGFTGWYQGMQAQIVKAVLSQALLFVSKEQFEIYAFVLLSMVHKLRNRSVRYA